MSNVPLLTSAFNVSVLDKAHALTAASAGFTVPFTEPVLTALKANNPAAANAIAAMLILAFFITQSNYRLNKWLHTSFIFAHQAYNFEGYIRGIFDIDQLR